MAAQTSSLKSSVNQFAKALTKYAPRYGVRLQDSMTEALSIYYEQLMLWNQRLHLVAPSTPAEFATRHVLESLLALPHIGPGSLVIDLGSGGGLPIIPCLIARPDIQARLFEASPKKAVFLREALDQTGARQRAVVLDVRFEHRSTPQGNVVTCRAIERFAQMLPTIYDWSPPASRLLFFGSRAVQQWLESTTLEYHTFHIPESTQRYLFVLEKPAPI